jgi:hypothetical protein
MMTTSNLNPKNPTHHSSLSPDFHYRYDNVPGYPNYPWSTSVRDSSELRVELHRVEMHFALTLNYFSLHGANELPIGVKFNPLQYENAYDVIITPVITKTDKKLRKVSADKRRCYFQGEKRLKFFKIYTERNCEMECMTSVGE